MKSPKHTVRVIGVGCLLSLTLAITPVQAQFTIGPEGTVDTPVTLTRAPITVAVWDGRLYPNQPSNGAPVNYSVAVRSNDPACGNSLDGRIPSSVDQNPAFLGQLLFAVVAKKSVKFTAYCTGGLDPDVQLQSIEVLP